MREIKFRQLVNGEFHYWGVGLTDTQGYHSSFIGPMCGGRIRADQTPNDQYTGLKDVNGVEIYEGDIVKAELYSTQGKYLGWHTGEVVFNEFELAIDMPDDSFPLASWSLVHKCEVIGNIHLNPELLEASQC